MQKVLATLILALVFFFSVVGGNHHESCQFEGATTSISAHLKSDLNTHSDTHSDTHSITTSTSAPEVEHICHLGHCAFTLQKPLLIKTTTALITQRVLLPYLLNLSSQSDEMLRPPSRA